MDGYTPGEQPGVGERVVKLNTNENPFPPSPMVLRAIKEVEPEMLRRYPNPHADIFRTAAAKVLGITPDMILAGNGSDDILTIATRTFLSPGDLLAYPDPTYTLYNTLAKLQDAKVAEIPWDRDYALPIAGLLAAKPQAIYIANPNAPTGTFVSPLKIEELAQSFKGLVLVDEAYIDFADDSCLALIKQHENVVISRTFSKAYSLAGLRFGYAIGQPRIIHEMMKVKDSYNVDAIAMCAAAAAIADQDYAREKWEQIKNERERVTSELTQMGWNVLPSRANFVLAAAPDGRGREAYLGLKSQGILVRYFDRPGLSDKIRITIGQSHENNALLGGLRRISTTEKAA
jgi:histidinol-phosphate aminotransferase